MDNRRRGIKPFSAPCKLALRTMPAACRLAESLGLRLRYSTPLAFGRRMIVPGLHVQVNDAGGQRILNWWPSTSTWTAPDGQRGKCPDLLALVELATRIQDGEVLGDSSTSTPTAPPDSAADGVLESRPLNPLPGKGPGR